MKYSYQYWQNQLLAEMGIDRWALQTAEVIEIGLDELAESLMPFFQNNELQNKPFQKQTHQNNEIQANLPNTIKNIANENRFERFEPLDNEQRSGQTVENNPSAVIVTANVVSSFALQMAVFEEWVLMVDMAVISRHEPQHKLWQSLITTLGLTPKDFYFPLISQDFDNEMCTDVIALATFAGTVNAIYPNPEQKPKLLSLTALPSLFANTSFDANYHLATMLNDFQQKRKFWQTIQQRTFQRTDAEWLDKLAMV
ncbi:hypothetical protein [Moraxella boevrei]|uniref:hypothetical protein n=1 Tax=Faucicola boevrei TaxID=346665 RepID=UPI003736A98F